MNITVPMDWNKFAPDPSEVKARLNKRCWEDATFAQDYWLGLEAFADAIAQTIADEAAQRFPTATVRSSRYRTE